MRDCYMTINMAAQWDLQPHSLCPADAGQSALLNSMHVNSMARVSGAMVASTGCCIPVLQV